jgi:hypothetical protein
MISRNRVRFALAALALGCGFLAAACQKVPLLAPSGSIITLLATTVALPVNGSTDIIAQVIEPSGTPPQRGTRISFTTNLGTIQPSDAETDTSGKVVVKFFAGTGSGTATISAISGGVAVASANALKIAVGTAAVGGITISANPTSLSAAGGASTITAQVSDAGGNILPGVPVTFSTDNGTLSSSVVTTDAAGQAQTLLTTSRTAKVTAAAGVTTAGTGTAAATAPTASVTVNVNAVATVAFGAPTPNPGQVGQPVTFTLTVTPATTGGGQIRQVVVNFGDGASQTLGAVQGATTLSHTYNSSGVFALSATATDSNGDQFVGAGNIVVNPRPGLAVSISASSNPRANTPTTFSISATPSPASSITSVVVNFGDGESVTLQGNATSVQHVYSTGGQRTVTATATDTTGATGSGSTVIFVTGAGGGTVIATFTISPATGSAATTLFTFNGNGSTSTAGTITSFVWVFGDGQQTTTSTPTTTHSYAASGAGTYNVQLTVIDSQTNTGSATRALVVTP